MTRERFCCKGFWVWSRKTRKGNKQIHEVSHVVSTIKYALDRNKIHQKQTPQFTIIIIITLTVDITIIYVSFIVARFFKSVQIFE